MLFKRGRVRKKHAALIFRASQIHIFPYEKKYFNLSFELFVCFIGSREFRASYSLSVFSCEGLGIHQYIFLWWQTLLYFS